MHLGDIGIAWKWHRDDMGMPWEYNGDAVGIEGNQCAPWENMGKL